jgi:hypothetical protein
MKHYFQISLLAIASMVITNLGFANTLSNEAQNRGINSTCSSYLGQLEGIYNLDGLNLTFAYPDEPSLYPSLHSSTKKYNNGATIFSATLSPYDEYCYLSTVSVTIIKNQSCNDVSTLKTGEDPALEIKVFADGDYMLMTPENQSYQLVLVTTGINSCSMTETRMIWPGS